MQCWQCTASRVHDDVVQLTTASFGENRSSVFREKNELQFFSSTALARQTDAYIKLQCEQYAVQHIHCVYHVRNCCFARIYFHSYFTHFGWAVLENAPHPAPSETGGIQRFSYFLDFCQRIQGAPWRHKMRYLYSFGTHRSLSHHRRRLASLNFKTRVIHTTTRVQRPHVSFFILSKNITLTRGRHLAPPEPPRAMQSRAPIAPLSHRQRLPERLPTLFSASLATSIRPSSFPCPFSIPSIISTASLAARHQWTSGLELRKIHSASHSWPPPFWKTPLPTSPQMNSQRISTSISHEPKKTATQRSWNGLCGYCPATGAKPFQFLFPFYLGFSIPLQKPPVKTNWKSIAFLSWVAASVFRKLNADVRVVECTINF